MNSKTSEKSYLKHEKTVDLYEEVWSKGVYRGFSLCTIGAHTTPFLDAFIKLVKEINKDPAKIIEFGAGSGAHSITLAKEGFTVTAIESSQTAVSLMKKRMQNENINLNIIDMNIFDYLKTDIRDEFIGIYANAVLHFLTETERQKLYKNLIRIQTQNSILAVSFKGVGDSLQKIGTLQEHTDAGPIYMGKDKIKRLFVSNPFPLIQEIQKTGYEHIETLHWVIPDYNIQGEDSVFIGLIAKKP
ncbi:class I SAM-dependent methyltransferase [Fluviispira vulneris]|uniref:class I SAM-dependent methyltransferase n=1 Tax=Fluviispira vulneris TaxID=2763012 RepID=UPI00164706AB|nr:class I SAM-dependent methyltransferase [Fluviispira vulneris]